MYESVFYKSVSPQDIVIKYPLLRDKIQLKLNKYFCLKRIKLSMYTLAVCAIFENLFDSCTTSNEMI